MYEQFVPTVVDIKIEMGRDRGTHSSDLKLLWAVMSCYPDVSLPLKRSCRQRNGKSICHSDPRSVSTDNRVTRIHTVLIYSRSKPMGIQKCPGLPMDTHGTHGTHRYPWVPIGTHG